MKLYSKLFLLVMSLFLLGQRSYARDIILITYDSETQTVQSIKDIFKRKFKIPDVIVRYEKVLNPCQRREDIIMHFCVIKGEFRQLISEQEIIKNAFPVFLQENIRKAGQTTSKKD